MTQEPHQDTGNKSQGGNSGYGTGYGKRPLWQWILIYIVVGGLVYWAIYYFFFSNKPGGLYGTNTTTTTTNSQTTNLSTNSASIVTTQTSSNFGQYLADGSGNTLYTLERLTFI